MEHIPVPSEPLHPPLQVRFWGSAAYFPKPFLDHVEHMDWVEAQRVEPRGKQPLTKPMKLNAILQASCFFGLLHEVFGRKVSKKSLVRQTAEGVEVVTTESLPLLVKEWAHEECRKPLDERRRDAQSAGKCYIRACQQLNKADNPANWERSIYNKPTLLSCGMLLEYVQRIVNAAYGTPLPDEEPVFLINVHEGGKEFLRRRMCEDGWCRFEVQKLATDLSLAELYYISLMKRPGREKQHDRCSRSGCLAYQVTDETKYRRRHTCERQDCDDVPRVDLASQTILRNDLADALRGGAIPLIGPELSQDADGSLQIQFLSSHEHTDFVAISHLWSDGLGNPDNNSIPKCQYEYLVDVVTRLQGEPTPFWLDTICFPLGPQDAYELALIQMRACYEDAAKVLVLDCYLLEARWADLTADEALFKLLCCPWGWRLWTLQEGALATKLYFQFADTAVDIYKMNQRTIKLVRELFSTKLLEPQFDADALETRQHVCTLLLDQYWNLSAWEQLRKLQPMLTRKRKVLDLAEAKTLVSFRSTSVAEDEGLCLGNLLGLDSQSIAKAAPEQRMETLWRQFDEVPMSVLFWSTPRCTGEGLKWAPKSLRDCSWTSPVPFDLPKMRRSEVGLHVVGPGIVLNYCKVNIGRNFFFGYQVDRVFKAERSGVAGEEDEDGFPPPPPCINQAVIVVREGAPKPDVENDLVFRDPDGTVLKSSFDQKLALVGYTSLERVTGSFKAAMALVQVDEISEHQVIGRYVASMSVDKSRSSEWSYSFPTVLKGHPMPDDQQWLLL